MKPFVLLSDDGDFHVYPARLVPPIEKHLTKIEHARGEKYPDLPLILNEEPFYSLLPYFLNKYIDRSLSPFYRDLVVFEDGFEYYHSNLYTYKNLCQMIDEIEKVVKVYDSNISTDNEVLDVILSDMALRCQCNDIQFTCMVDGKQLSFMEEVDVYSLMGNMLENAFEYECKVQPSSDRFISVVIREIAEGVSIHVENYYIGDAVVENGIVETTKEDKNFHGFGMLSMKKHVEKYAGRLEVMIEDEMFQVDILIPKTDKEEP